MGFLDPEEHKRKTAHNRKSSAEILTERGIAFESKNDGAHLIVNAHGATFDFWPGTGKYSRRGPYGYQRGVFNLLKDIEKVKREVEA